MDGIVKKLGTVTAVVFAAVAFADVSVGYRERAVVSASAGETAAGKVVLGDGAILAKDGAGTLKIDGGKLRPAADVRIAVAEGGVAVTAGAAADFTTPPDVCNRAAYWVDANAQVVTTNNVPAKGETASTFVTKWCDRRETDTSSPSRIYAIPKWYENATYPASLKDVPPTLTTFDGRAGVFFGGATSGQYLRWQMSGANKSLASIYHLFIVHAVTNTLGHPVGYETAGRTGPLLNTTATQTQGYSGSTAIFFPRADVCGAQGSARLHLDGVKCDGHTTAAKRSWQLWQCDYFDVLPNADNFYRSGFTETLKGAQGGDYLGEVLVFTNRLMDVDCAEIERYLLSKWNLPDNKGLALRQPVTEFAMASNTTVAVAGEASTITPPLSFAGNGTVTKNGAGVLSVGPTDCPEYTGSFLWNAGPLRLQGGRLPAVAVASGEKYAFSGYRGSDAPSRAGDDASGLTCEKTATAAAGIVETTGNGWLRVNTISNNVRTVKVGITSRNLGAVLQLEGRVRGVAAPEEGALAATFVNPDMEMPFTITDTTFDRHPIYVNGTLNGWTSRANTVQQMCIQTPSSSRTWSQWLDLVAPQLGSNILQIVQAATVSTTVTVPKAGVYELSFDAKSRYYWGNSGFNKGYAYADQQSQVNILLGRNWSSASQVATLPIGCHCWQRFRYRISVPEAGSWELGLQTTDTGNDSCVFLDNFAMVRVPEPSREEICAIPNGNFDKLTRPCDPDQPKSGDNPYIHGCFTTLNRLTDWTLSVDPQATYGYALTNGVIGPVTTGTPAWKSVTIHLYPFADSPEGAGALAFVSTGGKASVNVTVPAGTWRLRGKAERYPTYWAPDRKLDKGFTGTPKVKATITRADGSAVVDLGLISPTAQEMRTFVWPTTFTLAADETVTLAVEQTVSTGIAVLDDLELVKEATRDGDNLLADPGFETAGTSIWMNYQKAGYTNAYWVAGSVGHADRPQYWGYSVFEGSRRLRIQNAGGVYQDIMVPEAGLYRFKMHVRARADSTAHANNPVRVFMTQGTVTNVFATTPTLFTRHWVEVTYLAKVATAGTWRFFIEGQCRPDVLAVEESGGYRADLDAHIDGVSLVRCRDEIDEVPEMPSNVKFEVAEGAQLLLDYTGTAKCGPVKYAGQVFVGTIDATTHPEFVTGLGALEAIPSGTLIMFR